MLLRNRGFSAVVLLTLAVGIGVNTSIFSVVSGVLLRPVNYPELPRLVEIKAELFFRNRVQQTPWLQFDEVNAWARQRELPVILAAHAWLRANLTDREDAERVTCGCVSSTLLRAAGVRPLLGRDFLPEEDRPGAAPVVILSHRLWQRRYGGDSQVLGQTVTLERRSCPVIGVLPADFQLTEGYDLLLPLAPGQETGNPERLGSPRAFCRLKPGVGLPEAQAALDAIYQQAHNPRLKGRIVLANLRDELVSDVKGQLLVLLGAVCVVLLIATSNVANLLLARGAERQHEITMRLALGATRNRIVRQLLTESVLLGLLGGIAGVILAYWATQLLRPWISVLLTDQYPIASTGTVLGDIRLNGWGLAFTMGVSILAGLLSGLAPALSWSRTSIYDALREGSHGVTAGQRQRGVRNLLVVSEIALALVLVMGAGLLIKSYVRLRGVDPGFRADHLLCFIIDLNQSRYPEPRSQRDFFRRVISELGLLPGVQAAAANSMLPLIPGGAHLGFAAEVENSPAGASASSVFEAVIDPGYFRTLGIPLLRGRTFTEHDRAGGPEVVVVSESFVRRHFLNEDPIGRRLRNPSNEAGWSTIVGVVGNVHEFDLETWEGNQQPQVYRCYLQAPRPLMCLAVKTAGQPAEWAQAVRRCVAAVDRGEPVYGLITLERRLAATLDRRRSYLAVLASFAGVALGLAALGIYGVTSWLVAQRTHEIGVRMALGASRGCVLRSVLKQGLTLGLTGLGVGLCAAIALTRIISSELYGVPAIDLPTYAIVSIFLLGVAMLACWVPARRATRVDPMVALRCE
jgi:putative ABC transport system permease protein